MQKLIRRLEEKLEDGLSQRQLAEKGNVDPKTIRNILAGQQPRAETLDKIAAGIFKVPKEEVYRWAGILPNEDTEEFLRAQIFDEVGDLTPAQQAEVLALIKRLQARKEKAAEAS